MKTYIIVSIAALVLAAPTSASAQAGNSNMPAFVDTWHGLGSDHQADSQPGDTAPERHNFDQATAGNSGINPTY